MGGILGGESGDITEALGAGDTGAVATATAEAVTQNPAAAGKALASAAAQANARGQGQAFARSQVRRADRVMSRLKLLN